MEISDDAKIKCDYELFVKVVNKSNIQSETLSRVTLDNIVIKRVDLNFAGTC
jgi:hypothetical protein